MGCSITLSWLSLRPELQAAWIGVGGAVIGGVIASLLTGWVTVAATNRAHRHALERDRAIALQRVVAFVQAVQAEIESALISLRDIIKTAQSLDGTQPLESIFPANRVSFEVFEASAQLLGGVDDRDLRKTIVKTYAAARAFVDTVEYNNRLVAALQGARAGMEVYDPVAFALDRRPEIARLQLVSFSYGIVRAWQEFDTNLGQFWERTNAWLRTKGAQENPPPQFVG